MKAVGDRLAMAVTELEVALARGDVSKALLAALEDVEAAAREHALELDPVRGKVVDVDRPLIPSPGLARHVGGLRQELGEVVAEAATLRNRLAAAVVAPGEVDRLCQRARRLTDALEHFRQEEARLIQESVNTDIGAGD